MNTSDMILMYVCGLIFLFDYMFYNDKSPTMASGLKWKVSAFIAWIFWPATIVFCAGLRIIDFVYDMPYYVVSIYVRMKNNY